jgi:hypothetical protein
MFIWLERWFSTSRVESARSRKRDSQSELHIQVGFGPSVTLFIQAAFTLGSVELESKVVISGRENKRQRRTIDEYDIE